MTRLYLFYCQGMLTFTPLISACIDQFGWRKTLRYISVGTLGLGVIVSLFLTDPPTESEECSTGGDAQTDGVDESEQITWEAVKEPDPESPSDKTSMGEAVEDRQKTLEHHDNSNQTRSCQDQGSRCARCSCLGEGEIYQMIIHIDPWLWSIGACTAMMGWTFFLIHFVSTNLLITT